MLTVADTAYSIAEARAQEGTRPEAERLFVDPVAHLFAAAGEHAREGTERYLALPFFLDGIRLRTRFIDDQVREGLAAGLKQLVILGAGFDARAMRMPELEEHGAKVYEVDAPVQIDRKREILAKAGVAIPRSCAYVPFDFDTRDIERELPGELARAGFLLGGGAIFIWEGVVGYISHEAIAASLRFMVKAGGPGTRLVFNFGMMTFEKEGLDVVAKRAGFTSTTDTGCDELWRRYLTSEPHPNASFVRLGTATV